MLFLSRHVNVGGLGVVDSDTGIEVLVDKDEVIARVAYDRVEILGAVWNGSFVESLIPYQLPEKVTSIQAKTNMLKHVDVHTYGDMITSIRWGDEITEPVTIRLSDFGTRLADLMLMDNPYVGRHMITLVFDDKLYRIEGKAFWCERNIIYLGKEGLGVGSSIIDHKERFYKFGVKQCFT